MADINIKVNGDASSAQNAMRDTSKSLGLSVAAWQELGAQIKKVGDVVVKFALDSVKAYAESERVTRQLSRVAGEYTEALEAQAEALSVINAVDDDVIKQQQVLLAQWGGVGAATSKVTQAVIDYAAYTRQDAIAATQDLIRNVESGGVGMAKLGLHFKATGDKGKDLAAVVEMIGKKMGGAGAADAQSLAGQLRLAEMAFEDVQKSFGSLIGAMESKFGVLDKVAGAMRGIARAVGSIDSVGDLFEVLSPGGIAAAAVSGATLPPLAPSDAGLPGISTVKGRTNKGMRADASGTSQADLDDESLERTKKFYASLDDIEEHANQKEKEDYAKDLEMSAKRVELAEQESAERVKVRQEMLRKIEKENAEHAEKMEKEAAAAQAKAEKEARQNIEAKEKQWKATGDQIGAAFVNALSSQLEKLADGGEFDAAQFIGSILSTVFAVAASAIGSAYGMPAVGAAIGNLGAMGIQAGFGELSRSNRRASNMPQKYHSGGWIGGDEHLSITQEGERVLSRQEVSVMGGKQAVDRAAKGGGSPGVNVYVSALNAKSVAESVETDFGLGLRRALRNGRGNVGLMGMVPA